MIGMGNKARVFAILSYEGKTLQIKNIGVS
jgi:hypothetical protein